MIRRDTIVQRLCEELKPMPYAHALWLEGADANGSLDDYSDIDVWLDIEDQYEAEAVLKAEEILRRISAIDYQYNVRHGHPKIRQRIYHLQGSSEYLMIDFCWQLHSRDMDGFAFYSNDRVENALVLFDKAGVVRFTDRRRQITPELKTEQLAECDYRFSQHCRVRKYVLRKQYPEGYAYYNRYVIEPLVILLRLIYTPEYSDYYLIHISSHIPAAMCERLEYFLRISSLEDIQNKTLQAEQWYQQLREMAVE